MDVREATRIALLAEAVLTGSRKPSRPALERLLTDCAAAGLVLNAAQRRTARRLSELTAAGAAVDPEMVEEIARLHALLGAREETISRLSSSLSGLREAHETHRSKRPAE